MHTRPSRESSKVLHSSLFVSWISLFDIFAGCLTYNGCVYYLQCTVCLINKAQNKLYTRYEANISTFGGLFQGYPYNELTSP